MPLCRMGQGLSHHISPGLVRGVRFVVLLSSSAECPARRHFHVCSLPLATRGRRRYLMSRAGKRVQGEGRQLQLFRIRSALVQKYCSSFYPWCSGIGYSRSALQDIGGFSASCLMCMVELRAGCRTEYSNRMWREGRCWRSGSRHCSRRQMLLAYFFPTSASIRSFFISLYDCFNVQTFMTPSLTFPTSTLGYMCDSVSPARVAP